ncbi:cytochrome c [Thauera sinica]|uniref:Cytochrome c n=1 Tax=Thauera sinica TaxID=2665146 RepID=A0ABW1AX58_9RHOO|nr:cytochrome c [Thauera sp. K11]ATE61894.1 cytochrome C [Thauera sp. K11]
MKKQQNRAAMPLLIMATALVLMSSANAADPVRERIDGFKDSKRAIAEIKDAIEKGDMTTVAKQARSMVVFARKIPGLYPPDAQGGFFSAAKRSIWTNFPDFVQRAEAFESSAWRLAELAASSDADVAALSKRLQQVADSCAACHRSYKRGR